jgi:hypothetical protein
MQLVCEDNYIQVPKWASLGGLIPVAPECQPDSEKERRKSIMSNAALDILRESSAKERCKERFLQSDESIPGVLEEDLRKVLYDRKAVSPAEPAFMHPSASFCNIKVHQLTFRYRWLCQIKNFRNFGGWP